LIYVETSVLLKVLLREEGYETSAKILEKNPCITSSLTFIEARRAISRLLSLRSLNEADSRDLLGTLQILSREWSVMEITKEIQLRAGQGFDIEPVRTLDAIHLATALECRQIFRDLKVHTFDKRIEDNLKPLGLIGYETS
jgi:predicted nucleic acid-binding protein